MPHYCRCKVRLVVFIQVTFCLIQVHTFWRRAIYDGGTKIHCLINADMLAYDVCEAAERYLEAYLQDVHYKGCFQEGKKMLFINHTTLLSVLDSQPKSFFS